MEIEQKFKEGEHSILLTGIGGIGKTSIANAYYWKHRKNISPYRYIRWLKYEDNIRNTYLNSGLNQFYPISSKNPDAIYKAIQIGENNLPSPKLLVIDNCNNLNDRLLRDFSSFDILLTSRHKSDNLFTIETPPLESEELKKLFSIIANITLDEKNDEIALDNLLSILGSHTLMTVLLAKLLRKQKSTNLDIQILAKTYKAYSDDFLNRDKIKILEYSNEERISSLIEKTFELTKLKETKYYDLIHLLLSNSCILPDVEISEFSKWLKVKEHKYLNNSIVDLEELGWIDTYKKNKKHYIGLHPFIKEVLQVKLKPDTSICRELILALAKLVDIKFHKESSTSKFRLIGFCEGVLQEFYGEEEVIILQSDLGNVYMEQYEFEKSKFNCEAALDIAHTKWGEYHPKTAQIHNNLGLAYWQLGDLNKAEKEFQTALEIDTKTYGEGHEEVVIDYHNLALIYLEEEKQNLDLAEKYFRKSLDFDIQNYGRINPTVAIDLNCLSKVFELREDFQESIKLVEESLSILHQHLRKNNQSNDLKIAKRLRRLAILYAKSKLNIEYAHFCADESLRVALDIVSEDNLFIGLGYRCKCDIFIEEKKYKAALKMLNKSLKIYNDKFGVEHEKTIELISIRTKLEKLIKEEGERGTKA